MRRFITVILTFILAAGCLQSCPAAEVSAGSHTYQLVISDCTWTEAFQEAKNAGGYLAHIDSREEYQTILQQINNAGASNIMFRIGGRRDPSSGSYYWMDANNAAVGQPLNDPSCWAYNEWMNGEPSFQDGAIQECYLDMYYFQKEGRWVWNDVPDDIIPIVPGYSGRLGYIIEFDGPSGQPAPGAPDDSWQEAYRQFIQNQTYLSGGLAYGDEISSSKDEIAFALHDMDGNGIPELIAFNGDEVYAGSVNYLYQYSGGDVSYTGTMPGYSYNLYYYMDDPALPGLFCSGAHTGMYWTDYYRLNNGYLFSEQVSQSTDENGSSDPDTGEYIPVETLRTNNDALYNAYLQIKNDEGGNSLPFCRTDEISQMGWDAFLSLYGYSAASGSSGSGEALADPASLLSSVPDQFYFSSGAGAWSTDLTLFDDGSFTGMFHDSDMGSDTEHYPGGEVYICEFSGKFRDFRKVDEYTWSMRLESLSYRYGTDQDWEDEGVHYIASDAYGISGGDQFYLYLEGHPVSTLPEGYLNWARMYMGAYGQDLPSELTVYGIYNVAEENGFGGSW